MRRGDIYWVDLEPSVPGESARTRRAVILTNDLANETLPHLMVAPITSNTDRQYPLRIGVDKG